MSQHLTITYRLGLHRENGILHTSFVLKTDKEYIWALRRCFGHSETRSSVHRQRFHVLHVCTVSHGCYYNRCGIQSTFTSMQVCRVVRQSHSKWFIPSIHTCTVVFGHSSSKRAASFSSKEPSHLALFSLFS